MIQRWIAVCCVLLAWAPAQASAQSPAPGLQLVVLQGAGVTHLVNRNRHEVPTVLVRDQDNRPLKGARVTFYLPESGPGGSFGKERRTLAVQTNKEGRAEGKGFRPNRELGEFVARVTAEHNGIMAETQFKQTNAMSETAEASKKSGRSMLAVHVLLVGVSAVVAAIAAARQVNQY